MTQICITGARGFIGSHLVRRLAEDGHMLRLAMRTGTDAVGRTAALEAVDVGEIGPDTDWRPALEGCRVVVHLAAETPRPGVPDERFRRVNDEGTARLASQCAEAGVEVLILLSSILAVADNASAVVIDDSTEAAAASPYGRSKRAAEEHVQAFTGAGRTGVALRAPLVYGASARGNWHLLQRLAASGLPLPFGGVQNRRSVIAVETLCDAIAAVVVRVAQPGQGGAFAVADADAVSVADMLRWLRAGMGQPARLVPMPAGWLRTGLNLAGKGSAANSLLGDLVVDSSRFCAAYGWAPQERVEDAMRRSGRAFLAERNQKAGRGV